jgi:PiT family inorganic phosphate transporter
MLLEITILFAFFFSFWNGLSDAANSISTVIGTRVLSPFKAVLLAAIGNFLGIALGVAVATTIGQGIVAPSIIGAKLVLAVLVGGMVWEIITWYYGIPVSESHVMVGGLIGAGIAAGGMEVVNVSNIGGKIILPMITSPLIAGIFAFVFTGVIIHLFSRIGAKYAKSVFNKLQIGSAFFLSVTHGANDAQKTAGLITALLLTEGMLTKFEVPLWVFIGSYAAISLGTFFGGWRIIKTMSFKVTDLKPYQGFAAETSSALVLSTTAHFGIPVSTTQAISGAIMGVGATRRLTAVNWVVTRRIFYTWFLTIPASAVFAFATYLVLNASGIK